MAIDLKISRLDLPTVIAMIERDLPEWNWLLRSNDGNGYFANITSPDFHSIVGLDGVSSSGFSAPIFAETAVAALSLSYEQVMNSRVVVT